LIVRWQIFIAVDVFLWDFSRQVAIVEHYAFI
jgi:hypothetical protein